MDEHNRHYLTQLHFRLRRSGFSFQHEDFLELQDALPSALEDIAGAEERAEKYKEMADELAEALGFYADPETYAAIGFFPDRPCGEFIYDFSDCGMLGEKPGAKAREAIIKYDAMKGEE